MIFKRYERAQKWLRERNPDYREGMTDSQGNEELPSMEELRAEANEQLHLDKGDVFALIIAALVNIFIPCVLFLLFVVGVALWIF